MPDSLPHEKNPQPTRRHYNARPFLLASLAPIPALFFLFFTRHSWSRWLQIGQQFERLLGMIWIGTTVLSVACVLFGAFARKRWYVWLSVAVHGLFLLFTFTWGFAILAWLMHWRKGPGA
jgi:hypothetical protein